MGHRRKLLSEVNHFCFHGGSDPGSGFLAGSYFAEEHGSGAEFYARKQRP